MMPKRLSSTRSVVVIHTLRVCTISHFMIKNTDLAVFVTLLLAGKHFVKVLLDGMKFIWDKQSNYSTLYIKMAAKAQETTESKLNTKALNLESLLGSSVFASK